MSTIGLLAPQYSYSYRSSLPAQSNATLSGNRDITIGQAVSALVGAAAVATIETVGNTASSIVQTPRAIAQAYKTLYKTDKIGPVLKTAIAVTLPVALVAGPAATALGSFGYGLFRGASEAIEHDLATAVSEGFRDIGRFNKDVAGKLVDAMKEEETEKLPEGQKPYDIKVLEAGKGLVGGIAGAAIVGGGVGAITALRTPQGVIKAYSEIWKSDMGPVLKTTASILVPPAAIVAAPLGLVGGAVYGIATGFAEGYQKGVSESIAKSVESVGKVNDGISAVLKNN